MTNPLLNEETLPAFGAISIDHFEPALEQVLADNRQLIEEVLGNSSCTWESLVYPLESASDRLSKVWSVISHYNGVLNSEALRKIYKNLTHSMTEYQTEMGQNKALYEAYKKLYESKSAQTYSAPKRKALENTLRDFRLSGVGLNEQDKKRFSELKQALSSLTNSFSDNALDATEGWTKHFETKEILAGLPDSAIALLTSLASDHGYDSGYLLTLDIPSYLPVMTYCDNRDLREEMYRAFVTRASDQGPNAGKWDNTENINQIMVVRQELSALLSYKNYAECSLASKMASSVDEVTGFLDQLRTKSYDMAMQQLEALRTFAKKNYALDDMEMWDIPYYSEKLRQQLYDVSQEELKPYFPVPAVIKGLFNVASRLFAVDIEENSKVETWHPDVRYYSLSRNGEVFAGFYFDLYARKHKRGGAWMAECRVRRRLEGGDLQQPVAFLTCNFTPPINGKDSLLTHDEVTTLFHEFGHGLHHMLTKIEVGDVSGIAGVPWDVVELPSQFLENWCWQEESIALISSHHETNEPLPKALLDKMLKAKHFQSGMHMMRQLEFALFDMILHRDYSASEKTDVQTVLDSVRDKVSVKKPPAYARSSHTFGHIFAGGYAAGYYSYKWAEVLAADAFSKFEEEGIFNPKVGQEFCENILEVGGSLDAMDMFVAFRGRKPSVDPLLLQSGISPQAGAG